MVSVSPFTPIHGLTFYPTFCISLLITSSQLTVSYEVPALLAPVASALQPFLEGLLQRGLERFTTFAKTY
ncbi:Polyketide cyclase / dehydrase and lipid transport protein [Quillaja saponaria]|uniref:Polyketide cyclase / dehydrase and lipid transport protein n=1 Tax=Quillaja saponaria TaxID=32244 RepID=A0AAD7VEQ8_QUISA|nr:Polyketide cyclase / dehydrase and lipid transport protein [Quillaja saponaria]